MVGAPAGGNICQDQSNWGAKPAYFDLMYNRAKKTPLGHVFGFKGQVTHPDYTWSALIPQSFLKSDEDHDTVIDILKRCTAVGSHVMGGNVAILGDGMDALSKGYRSAGIQQMISGESYSWCVEALQKMTLKYLGVENTTNPTIPFPG